MRGTQSIIHTLSGDFDESGVSIGKPVRIPRHQLISRKVIPRALGIYPAMQQDVGISSLWYDLDVLWPLKVGLCSLSIRYRTSRESIASYALHGGEYA